MRNAKGSVRGYDVRTGKRLWIFHTIPRRGEFGDQTWLEGSAEYNGNTGVWAQMSADPELGLVYVPTVMAPRGTTTEATGPATRSSRTPCSRWTSRPDAASGTTRPCITTCGTGICPARRFCSTCAWAACVVKAIAQPTKQAMLFVFNRETGEPIWPIEERPVPASNVPQGASRARRSRFRPGRRPSIVRGSARTICSTSRRR